MNADLTAVPSAAIEAGARGVAKFYKPSLAMQHAIARAVLEAASERIECPAPADWHQLGCVCGGSGFFFILRETK